MTASETAPKVAQDPLARLEEIRQRYGARVGDVECLLAGYDALLKLHGDDPIYALASDCDHPEPEDDSGEEWEAWEQDHPAGAGGGRVCELTEEERACLECSRLSRLYDDTAWISPAECTVRSAITAALAGEVPQ